MSEHTPTPRFGPAGNSERFYQEGNKRTVETFAWQRAMGLTAFEYPFGRGISLSDDTAVDIGRAAQEAGVTISAHAPYYINLGSNRADAIDKSLGYILKAAHKLRLMGGERLVVHVGAPQKRPREDAISDAAEGLLKARRLLMEEGLQAIRLCLETMGKPSVLGTLEEIITFVRLDDSFLPCVDFAHLHAAGGGALSSRADFARVLDAVEQGVGRERAAAMHVHFSHIEYGRSGEIRHRIFADEGFGPDFAHLAPLLVQRGYAPTIICESRGTMADDAAEMLAMYNAARRKHTPVI